jgi:hypothetical protein
MSARRKGQVTRSAMVVQITWLAKDGAVCEPSSGSLRLGGGLVLVCEKQLTPPFDGREGQGRTDVSRYHVKAVIPGKKTNGDSTCLAVMPTREFQAPSTSPSRAM